MDLNDITLVIAIDKKHLNEWKMTYPTWHRFKPEVMSMKRIIIYDDKELTENDFKFGIDDKTICVPWHVDDMDQRGEMLSSLVYVPASHVKTKWYLKLDVDAIATKRVDNWIDYSWFTDDITFISQRWGFSKPSNVLETLDNWGDTIPILSKFDRLNIPYNPTWSRVHCRRIISWCFFGNTEWTKFVVNTCGNKLPVLSQDTIMYYMAARMKKRFLRLNFKPKGWMHFRVWNLKKTYNELGMDEYVKRNNIL